MVDVDDPDERIAESSQQDDGIPDPEGIDWGPTRRPLEEGDPCPECDYPFDSDEWETRHVSAPDTIGEDWLYTCPNCEQETCMIGT